MIRKKVLFVVHTEYHMLVTLSIISNSFHNQDLYQIFIYQTDAYGSKRFKFIKDLSSYLHINYFVIHYDESVIEVNLDFIHYLNFIRSHPIDIYFLFNKLTFIDFATCKELKKKGAKIVLAPDGAAAYATISRFTPRWSFLLSFRTHVYLWKNGLRKFYFYWPTLVYGALDEIEELWVQYPEGIDRRAKNKVVKKIGILDSKSSVKMASAYFGDGLREETHNILFYANQPFRDSKINEVELLVLKRLREMFPSKHLIVKLHPSTYLEQENKINKIHGITIVKSTFPSELFIAKLTDSLVFSFWSTSLLVDNPTCKFYWLYPMLAHFKIKLHKMSLKNPTIHIKLIKTLDEV